MNLGRNPMLRLEFLCYQMPTFTALAFLQATNAPDWATLGVGGILAGGMFLFYREDRKRSEAERTEIAKDLRDLAKAFREVVEDNSRAISTLTALMDRYTRER